MSFRTKYSQIDQVVFGKTLIPTSLNHQIHNIHAANVSCQMKASMPLFCANVNTGSIINEISANILISSTDGYVNSSRSLVVSCVNIQVFRTQQPFNDLFVSKLGGNMKSSTAVRSGCDIWFSSPLQQNINGFQSIIPTGKTFMIWISPHAGQLDQIV